MRLDDRHLSTIPDVPTEIRTERLLLRPYREEDADALFTAIEESRAELGQWLDWTHLVTSVADTRETCEMSALNWMTKRDFMIGVFSADGSRLLGSTGLHHPNWQVRSFEIGYWLRTSAVGHGYMRETVAALTRTAFDELRARRVEIRCDPDNVRSRRVAEASGYVLEGHLRDARLTSSGAIGDTLIFALTAADAQRPALGVGS